MTDTETTAVDATAGPRAVLITGADGYVGRLVTRALAADPGSLTTIVATDVREVAVERREAGVDYVTLDVRSGELAGLLERHAIDTVVHLASIVNPSRDMPRETQYEVDVVGTQNVLDACLAAGVSQVVVTSSGAAYGYHADNAALLTEDSPLRGNDEFAYSQHKRLVEELLARYREQHPELGQLVLRPGTVLGESVSNQITALFERPFVLVLDDVASPFVFIWDEDLVGCILEGVRERKTGIYNVAGDGAMTLRETAARLGKRTVSLPSSWVGAALAVLSRIGVTQYGPEQLRFLEYRPVLSNEKLKHEFGYTPRLDSRAVFDLYCRSHGHV